MRTAIWGVLAIVAQSVLAWGGGPDRGTISCDTCGVENAAILAQITRLQTCPRRREREHSAHALRKFDWRCHPEVVEVLAFALLHDPEEEVREEAAQSLTKMAPCLPAAHEALSRAAERDPDHSTRRWARKGLKALGHRCEGACKICGPVVVGPIAPVPAGPKVLLPAPAAGPGELVMPPIDSSVVPLPPLEGPAPPPQRLSPFSGGPELFAPGSS